MQLLCAHIGFTFRLSDARDKTRNSSKPPHVRSYQKMMTHDHTRFLPRKTTTTNCTTSGPKLAVNAVGEAHGEERPTMHKTSNTKNDIRLPHQETEQDTWTTKEHNQARQNRLFIEPQQKGRTSETDEPTRGHILRIPAALSSHMDRSSTCSTHVSP